MHSIVDECLDITLYFQTIVNNAFMKKHCYTDIGIQTFWCMWTWFSRGHLNRAFTVYVYSSLT